MNSIIKFFQNSHGDVQWEMVVFIGIIALFALVMICLILFEVINSGFLKRHTAQQVIITLMEMVDDSCEELTYRKVDGKLVLQNTEPEDYQYWIRFSLFGQNRDFEIDKKKFDQINVGDTLNVEYGIRRITRSYLVMDVDSPKFVD